MIGSSAGGHLAATLLTKWDEGNPFRGGYRFWRDITLMTAKLGETLGRNNECAQGQCSLAEGNNQPPVSSALVEKTPGVREIAAAAFFRAAARFRVSGRPLLGESDEMAKEAWRGVPG